MNGPSQYFLMHFYKRCVSCVWLAPSALSYYKKLQCGEYTWIYLTRGVHRKALILNANVYNHCIRYKIPSGPVNIVGSFKYLVHLYFQYMSAAKLHQSHRTYHIIFNVEYLKSVKNIGL